MVIRNSAVFNLYWMELVQSPPSSIIFSLHLALSKGSSGLGERQQAAGAAQEENQFSSFSASSSELILAKSPMGQVSG